jgi:DNA mismatch repair ATPase MutS
MSFNTDKQTLDDLTIFAKGSGDSVYGMYNRTFTRGGANILEQMFRSPLSDVSDINIRSQIIQYFNDTDYVFPFKGSHFDQIEQYLGNTDERSMLAHESDTLKRTVAGVFTQEAEYKIIYKGIVSLIEIVGELRSFMGRMKADHNSTPYHADMSLLSNLLAVEELEPVWKAPVKRTLPYNKVAEFDRMLRFRYRNVIRKFLQYLYHLDVYMSVAKVATERKFIFPRALRKEEHTVKLKGVYHPQLKAPIPNSIHITPNANIVFLTGANMAGKSTFMKSIGIAMYVAHMGFPVAARSMEFSVRDGIYTTINLPDDLSMGASHFYAEVLRIKKVAMEMSHSKSLFIMFDELFRGTNVKDAYEGTISVTEAFAHRRNCLFILSTHIVEAGEVLKEKCDNISFKYLPTRMNGNIPVYTYQVETGITDDRHGMIIINNEGILDILKASKTKAPLS